MNLILKIAVVALAGAILSSVLKESKPEFVLPMQVVCVILTASLLINFGAEKIGSFFEESFGGLVESSYIELMLKGALVSVFCTICASLCRESGNRTLGDMVELSGRVLIIMFCVPLIKAAVKTALMYVK